MAKNAHLVMAFLLSAIAAFGQEGVHNPIEWEVPEAPGRGPSIGKCQGGYYLTKAGSHVNAFQVHIDCAEAGYTRSMIWLAYVYQNGLSPEGEVPEKVAYWDKRAAEAGNEVGMFNYGIDLIRGYGVSRNEAEGRQWIARAASGGHKHAKELIATDFDLAIITPDPDEAGWLTKGAN